MNELAFLRPNEMRFLSQIQGRTYANIFGLVERYIGAKTLEISRDYWLGDQVALEALVRFTDEELKHQELFRRIEALMAAAMAPGYAFGPQGNDVAQFVLGGANGGLFNLGDQKARRWMANLLNRQIREFGLDCWRTDFNLDPAPYWDHWETVEEYRHFLAHGLEWRRVVASTAGAPR